MNTRQAYKCEAEGCGATVMRTPGHVKNHVYCSRRCYDIGQKHKYRAGTIKIFIDGHKVNERKFCDLTLLKKLMHELQSLYPYGEMSILFNEPQN